MKIKKIRYEKLQFDINKKAVLGKIDKYEYLTGEEILSSDQSKTVEQFQFTNFSLGNVFEKQTIEHQAEKQIKALEENWKQLFKSNVFAKKANLPSGKQKEIFYKLVTERMERIEKLHKSIDFNNLTYHYKGPNGNVDFNNFIAQQLFLTK